MDDPEFNSRQGREQFLLSKASELDMGLTLSAGHWVPRALSQEESLSRREAKCLNLVPWFRVCVELQLLTSDKSSCHTQRQLYLN